MFTPIWDGYHPWDKIFIYICEDVTMDYMQYCCNDVINFNCILKATEKLCKDKNGIVTCDEKNLPWFLVGYDFYPTCCVFPISSRRLGDRKHTTCWIKIISNHKPCQGYPIFFTSILKHQFVVI